MAQVVRVVVRLVSKQVLERCKFVSGNCPARASYRLELKRPSPPAKRPHSECSAVSGVIRCKSIKSHRSTVKATAPSRVHIHCHCLKVTRRQWTRKSASDEMLPPEDFGLPQRQGELWACCPSGGRAEDASSTGSKAPWYV